VAVDLAYNPPHATFLHIVDVGSRFSKAVAIPNKETPTVTRAMLAGWLVHHGAPRAILAELGAEIDSALFRSMTERFNVVALSTAGQAHHSNGTVERHNQTLKAMVRRLRRDHPAAPLQELLDLACLAENRMSIHNGASPFQLMCGSAPRLPAALTDSLPALGDRRVPGDDALRTHLSLLHAARAAHTQSDVSLRRALARNASNVPPRRWAVGGVVYDWTEGAHFSPGAWEGPAHVTDVAVAKDAVRLQHGNRWVTRHGSQVRPVVSAAVAFNEPAAPPAPAEGASASSLDSASSSGLSSDSEADAPSPSSDATASVLAGARAALRRVGSPPPAAPPVPSAWAGRTRQGGARRVRFSALPANANGSAEAALLSRSLSEQGGLAEYAVGLALSDSDLNPGPGAAASRLRRHKAIRQALFSRLAASRAAFDADWVPLLPGEAGGPPAATPLSAASPGDAPDAVSHAHRLYAFQVGRVEASLPPGVGRDARLWRVNTQLLANLAACGPTPRRDAVDHMLRRHDVSVERIIESCPAGALHNLRLGRARERILLAAAASDSLAAALSRSSPSAHAVLVKRR